MGSIPYIAERNTWDRRWAHPYESIASLTLKLVWANDARFSDVMRLFGVKAIQNVFGSRTGLVAYSFLSTHWVRRDFSGGELGSQPLQESFLTWYAGGNAALVATDSHFRFCPDCLRLGYHSSAFQVTSLIRCPIHRALLTHTCPNCGACNPEFSLNRDLLKNPFQCYHCKNFWTQRPRMGAWTASVSFDAQVNSKFGPIYSWLKGISRETVDVPVEDFCLRDFDATFIWKQSIACAVLGTLIKPQPDMPEFVLDPRVRVLRVTGAWNKFGRRDQCSVFKAIRRQIRRRLGKRSRLQRDPTLERARAAFEIWRNTFEGDERERRKRLSSPYPTPGCWSKLPATKEGESLNVLAERYLAYFYVLADSVRCVYARIEEGARDEERYRLPDETWDPICRQQLIAKDAFLREHLEFGHFHSRPCHWFAHNVPRGESPVGKPILTYSSTLWSGMPDLMRTMCTIPGRRNVED